MSVDLRNKIHDDSKLNFLEENFTDKKGILLNY